MILERLMKTIALTIACIGILQAVELLRQGSQGLRQQGQLFGVDGDLAGLGLENKALDADDIADIHLLETFVRLLTDLISGYIHLNAAVSVLDIAERGLAHDALEHHAAGDGDILALELLEIISDLGSVVSLVIFYDHKGVIARSLQLCQFIAADFLQLRHVLCLLLILLLVLFSHN